MKPSPAFGMAESCIHPWVSGYLHLPTRGEPIMIFFAHERSIPIHSQCTAIWNGRAAYAAAKWLIIASTFRVAPHAVEIFIRSARCWDASYTCRVRRFPVMRRQCRQNQLDNQESRRSSLRCGSQSGISDSRGVH